MPTAPIARNPADDRVRDDDDREPEPPTDQVRGATQRPGEHRLGDPGFEVRRDRRRAEERRGHDEHEAEHEGDEDQDLRDDELDLELADAVVAGAARRARDTPHAVSPTASTARITRTHRTRRRAASPIVSLAIVSIVDRVNGAAARWACRQAAGPGRRGRGSAARARFARSGPRGPWRPSPTRVETRSGTPVASIGRIASMSPSSVGGPKRSNAGRSSALMPVTRTCVSARPRTSSRSPLATTRPWSMIATRSQTCSTSVRRWEFRNTAAPRSAAARTMPRTSTRPTGSSAEVGSSRTISAGSPSSAVAEPEALLHALRELADEVARPVGEADHPEAPRRRRPGGAPRGMPIELGVERQHLARLEPRLVAEQLRQVADLAAGREVAHRGAEHLGGARRRAGQPEQQLDGRRLAGAVRTEEAEDLAAPDGHGQARRARRPGRSACGDRWPRSPEGRARRAACESS